jgi:hypothetical protein
LDVQLSFWSTNSSNTHSFNRRHTTRGVVQWYKVPCQILWNHLTFEMVILALSNRANYISKNHISKIKNSSTSLIRTCTSLPMFLPMHMCAYKYYIYPSWIPWHYFKSLNKARLHSIPTTGWFMELEHGRMLIVDNHCLSKKHWIAKALKSTR